MFLLFPVYVFLTSDDLIKYGSQITMNLDEQRQMKNPVDYQLLGTSSLH